ncbi:hypothetical protein IAG15_23765, partial [Enterococcus faecalis]|nr:hypothetical protein [Enterococcus faecalis]
VYLLTKTVPPVTSTVFIQKPPFELSEYYDTCIVAQKDSTYKEQLFFSFYLASSFKIIKKLQQEQLQFNILFFL